MAGLNACKRRHGIQRRFQIRGLTVIAFDEEKVAMLLSIFGQDDLALVLDAFLDEAEQVVIGLAKLTSDNQDRVRDHQLDYLARAAANMGASGLAEICRSYERSSAFEDADFRAVRAAFRQTCDSFTLRVQALQTDAA